jgi:DNA-binding MarR family transcriptional regulator
MVVLTKTQQKLLIFMYENRNHRISFENVRPFYKNPASASRTLNFLNKNGYIKMVKDSHDKRKNFYTITLKGIFFCEITGFGG